MASHSLLPSSRALFRSKVISIQPALHCTRAFRTSPRLMETPTAALPVRKPIGAFRRGLFGFLTGSTVAGAGMYYYVMEEYKVSNELLAEDIYALQAAVQRIHTHVQSLEEKWEEVEKKASKG
ncbi:MAG: hypothetical protein M1816_007787 [Peltula sp. TS41687]|nr:MAG: hypothetical protein M1816_007787 [Peltula sp. TS41687]